MQKLICQGTSKTVQLDWCSFTHNSARTQSIQSYATANVWGHLLGRPMLWTGGAVWPANHKRNRTKSAHRIHLYTARSCADADTSLRGYGLSTGPTESLSLWCRPSNSPIANNKRPFLPRLSRRGTMSPQSPQSGAIRMATTTGRRQYLIGSESRLLAVAGRRALFSWQRLRPTSRCYDVITTPSRWRPLL